MSQLMPWHLHKLKDPEYTRVDLVKEGANSQAHIKLMKNRGGTNMELAAILKTLKPEHAEVVQKAVDDAKKEAEDAAAAKKLAEDEAKEAKDAMAKMKGAPAPGTDPEEILKSVTDPALKSILETQIAKAKAAEDEIRKMRDAATQQTAIAKAKEVPHVGAEEAQLADIFKKLTNADPALAEDVFGIFKAANALIVEGGVFQEIGKGSQGQGGLAADEKAAWAQIESAADSIVKERNIKKTAAIQVAIQENPDLYKQYIEAQTR